VNLRLEAEAIRGYISHICEELSVLLVGIINVLWNWMDLERFGENLVYSSLHRIFLKVLEMG
jgi:hypothetical protein